MSAVITIVINALYRAKVVWLLEPAVYEYY
jgi:hypothetical protein